MVFLVNTQRRKGKEGKENEREKKARSEKKKEKNCTTEDKLMYLNLC